MKLLRRFTIINNETGKEEHKFSIRQNKDNSWEIFIWYGPNLDQIINMPL